MRERDLAALPPRRIASQVFQGFLELEEVPAKQRDAVAALVAELQTKKTAEKAPKKMEAEATTENIAGLPGLPDMTVKELKAFASDIGIKNYAGMKKAELQKAIEEALNG